MPGEQDDVLRAGLAALAVGEDLAAILDLPIAIGVGTGEDARTWNEAEAAACRPEIAEAPCVLIGPTARADVADHLVCVDRDDLGGYALLKGRAEPDTLRALAREPDE